ncbi:MAG TPA: hypothetical protein VNI01_13435 [Elusimicrobiota bacterium]|jgi:hypothetical protein|nr:hypothetical protein [Elusimicrobiota bacterium]
MIRSLRLVDDFLEEPEALAGQLRASPRPLAAVGGFLVAGLSIFLAQAISGRAVFFGVSSFWLAVVCLWQLGVGAAMSALVHLSAEMMGGKGRALALFSLFGLSDLAWTTVLPITLLWLAAFPGQAWASGLLTMPVFYGVLRLRARSVSHAYGLPISKAWTAVGAPYLAMGLMVGALFSVAIWGVFRQLLKLAA